MSGRTGTLRLKLRVAIILIIVALFLCGAVCSISFAKWTGGASSVTASGGVGQFYVDYDVSATAENEAGIKSVVARDAVCSPKAAGDGTYTYRNYVCVRREIDGTDGVIAFVDFSVFGADGTALDSATSSLEVVDFRIERAVAHYESGTAYNVAPNGNPTSASDYAPQIYNYPSTLGGINRVTKPGANTETQFASYADGGTYMSVFFEAGERQYCPMNVIITVNSASEPKPIKLKAEVSNWDYRNRYKVGYGAPLGFYLGGNINGVDNWTPRYSLKLRGTEISPATEDTGKKKADTNEAFYKYTDPLMSDITVASRDYGKVTQKNYHALFQYPTYIDASLNLNLSTESTLKMNMLDESGKRDRTVKGTTNGVQYDRINDRTVYFIPKNIVYPSAIDGTWEFVKGTFGFDFDMRFTKPGEYTFHYVGNVEYKLSGDGSSISGGNEYLSTTGTVTDAGNGCKKYALTASSTEKTGYATISDYNCLVDTLYITYSEQATDAQDKYHAVSFVNLSGKGGSIVPPDVKVKHGETVLRRIEIDGTDASGAYKVKGYYADIDKTPFDFTAPIKQDTTVYVEWETNIDKDAYYVVGLGDDWTVQSAYKVGKLGDSITISATVGDTIKIAKPSDDLVNPYYDSNTKDARNLIYSSSYVENDNSGYNNIRFKVSGEYKITLTEDGHVTVVSPTSATFIFSTASSTNSHTYDLKYVQIHLWTKDNGDYTKFSDDRYSDFGGDPMTSIDGRNFIYSRELNLGAACSIIITFRGTDTLWGGNHNSIARCDSITGTFEVGKIYLINYTGWRDAASDYNIWTNNGNYTNWSDIYFNTTIVTYQN